MAGFDAYLKAFAAVACLAFGLVVLSGRRRGAPLYLALFLFAIAANQGAETMRALALRDGAAWHFWWRVATVFAALDPLALYLFARASHPRPGPRAAVPVVASIAGTLALVGILVGSTNPHTIAIETSFLLFTASIYTLVALRFLHALARSPDDRRARLLFIAVAVVSVRPWVEMPYYATGAALSSLYGLPHDDPAFVLREYVGAIMWYVAFLGAIVGTLLASRLPNPRRMIPVVGLALGLGLVLTAALNSSSLVRLPTGGVWVGPEPDYLPGLTILGRASASVRWILFGGIVSAAILREDLLGMSVSHRRAAARALVALAMTGAAALAYAGLAVLFGPESVVLRPLDWAMIGLVLLATQGFAPLIDRVASRAYGVPLPADRAGAREAYRHSVAQALLAGRDPQRDEELARLRVELDITPTEALAIERATEETLVGPLVAGQRLAGRYVVRRLLARGGAGRVFLARDETLERDVVVKEVLDDEPGDDSALREARAAGGLQHPNVLVVHDCLRRPGVSLLVSEYAPGGSLAERVAARGPLSLAEAAPLLDGILAGLDAVHARGLVHRDLKPDNVLLTEDLRPKIADFGIARARSGATARYDEPDAFIGTPEFMAPEQRAGARATVATDVFAVGRIARSCVSGPLPGAVEAVVARALADDPAERFASAREMRTALAAAFASEK